MAELQPRRASWTAGWWAIACSLPVVLVGCAAADEMGHVAPERAPLPFFEAPEPIAGRPRACAEPRAFPPPATANLPSELSRVSLANRAAALKDLDIVFSGHVFRVGQGRVTLSDGAEQTRSIVLHPGSVVILPWVDARHVCLIRNSRWAIGGQTLYELPAGTLADDEDPLLAAGRELREETGYVAGRLTKLLEYYTSPGFLTEKMHVYVAEDLAAGPMQLEAGEVITTEVVAWNEVLDMIAEGKIVDGKTLLAILHYQWTSGRASTLAVQEPAPPGEPPPRPATRRPELVVLVHGMGRTRVSMIPLARALQEAGYDVLNWGYRSASASVPEAAQALAQEAAAAVDSAHVRSVHFVGHSLGNILIRWMIANDPPEKLGRVVMLAPPNQGSALADRFAPWLSWMLRPLPDLTTAEGSTVRTIPTPSGVEIGIIAGQRDTTVPVEETLLLGQTDHMVVPSGHSFIMLWPSVHRLIIDFLCSGRFPAATDGADRLTPTARPADGPRKIVKAGRMGEPN